MFEGKIRKHVKISLKEKWTFETMLIKLLAFVEQNMKDEIVAFSFIQEDGIKDGHVDLDIALGIVPEKGNMIRMYTREKRWMFILIRREAQGFITLVDISAPVEDMKLFEKLLDILVKETKGEISGDI
jgi:hypothetical protein